MIKKYLLGLLLVCVAFAGWGQEDLRFQYSEYSYDLTVLNIDKLANILMSVELNNRNIYFDPNGFVIEEDSIENTLHRYINDVNASAVDRNQHDDIFSGRENEDSHPFDTVNVSGLEYKHIEIEGAFPDYLLKYEFTNKIPIQAIQNYLCHINFEVYGETVPLNIYIFNKDSISNLHFNLQVEYLPNEYSYINDLTNENQTFTSSDLRIEILALALSVSRAENDVIEFSDAIYSSVKNTFYENGELFDELQENVSLSDVILDVKGDNLSDDSLHAIAIGFRNYLNRVFENSLDVMFESAGDKRLPVIHFNKSVIEVLYSDHRSYLSYYFHYLYESNYIPLAGKYSELVTYGENPTSYFNNNLLTEITVDQGESLADASLLYLLLHFSYKVRNQDMFDGLLNSWINSNRSGENSRLFNYALSQEQDEKLEIDKNIENNELVLNVDITIDPVLTETKRGIPYQNNGIDTPFLYYQKSNIVSTSNGHPIINRGVDSYGLLAGAMSMISEVSNHYYSVFDNKTSENINALNNLNANFNLEPFNQLSPLRTGDGLHWDSNYNDLSRILFNELKLYNYDLERNTKVVPSYSEARVGDIFVQYGKFNRYYKNNSTFNRLIFNDEALDYAPSIGIIVDIKEPPIVQIDQQRKFWVLSVRENDGACMIKPFEQIDNSSFHAKNPNNYVVRRLLISNDNARPVSNDQQDYSWSILSEPSSDIVFNSKVNFNNSFIDAADDDNTFEDRWIPNTGLKLGIESIDFELSENLENNVIDIKIISPADPWYGHIHDNVDHGNIYKNQGDYLLEFGFSELNLDGYILENSGLPLNSDWLVRFERKPSDECDSNGLSNYYIHYNPVYYQNDQLRSGSRLFLRPIESDEDENITHKLIFKDLIHSEFQHFYVAVRDIQDPDNNELLVDEKVGDDFILRFLLPEYNVSSDLIFDDRNNDGTEDNNGNVLLNDDYDDDNILSEYVLSPYAIKNRIAVYDHRLLWRANLYIQEQDDVADFDGTRALDPTFQYTDWNDRHPWTEGNEWNRAYDYDNLTNNVFNMEDFEVGNGGQVLELYSYTWKHWFGNNTTQDNRVAYDYWGQDSPLEYNYKMDNQKKLLEYYYDRQSNYYPEGRENEDPVPLAYNLYTAPGNNKYHYLYGPEEGNYTTNQQIRSLNSGSISIDNVIYHPYVPGVSNTFGDGAWPENIASFAAGLDCTGFVSRAMSYPDSNYTYVTAIASHFLETCLWDDDPGVTAHPSTTYGWEITTRDDRIRNNLGLFEYPDLRYLIPGDLLTYNEAHTFMVLTVDYDTETGVVGVGDVRLIESTYNSFADWGKVTDEKILSDYTVNNNWEIYRMIRN